MKINKSSWHTKLYQFWHKQKYGHYDSLTGTNLCPYMRAVLFWSWLRPIFLTKLGFINVPFLLIEVPRWLGVVSYNAKMVALFLYSLFVAIGLLFGLLCFMEHLGNKGKFDTFTTLVNRYSKSMHDRVCPYLTFE